MLEKYLSMKLLQNRFFIGPQLSHICVIIQSDNPMADNVSGGALNENCGNMISETFHTKKSE